MTRIEFDCDRCKKRVSGLHTSVATAGFYTVSSDSWKEFGRDGEHFVCDACIHAMPEYQAIYGAR